MRNIGELLRTTVAARAGVLLICLLGLLFFHHAIASNVVANVASMTSGMRISFADMQLATDRATFHGVTVSALDGEPIAEIPQLDVSFTLRDALPGGARQMGLRGLVIDRPHITIIHHADGSYNVTIPNNANAKPAIGPPFIFTARINDGALTLLDDTRIDPAARRLYVDGVNANLDVNTAARSRYTAVLAYREEGRAYPLAARGDIDTARGFMLQRVSAARIPLARLVAYGTNNPAVRMQHGELDGLDVRYFELARSNGALRPHLSGTAVLRDATVRVTGLMPPIRAHGNVDITDNGITTPGIAAALGTVSTRVTGGVYDFADPRLRFAFGGSADAAQFQRMATAASHLPPMQGPVRFRVLVEGSATRPLAFVSVNAPQLAYNAIPLQDVHGLIAADAQQLDVIGFRTKYGAIRLSSGGRIAFTRQADAIRLLLLANTPAGSLPYAADLVPGMTLYGTALATAQDPRRIDTRGFLHGENGSQTTSGIFHVDSLGAGTVGPIFVGNDRSSLYARIVLDHPHNRTVAFVNARNFRILPAQPVPLAGLRSLALPPIAATLDANVLGAQQGALFGAVGTTALRDARVGSFGIARADATFGGNLGDLELPTVSARGPWGAASGSGTVVMDATRTVAQVRHGRFLANGPAPPIQQLNATVGLRGNAIDVYAARARVGGGNAIARGSFGNGGTLSVSATGVNVAALRTLGIPLRAGNASVAAIARGTLVNPALRGAFVVGNASYANLAVGGAAAFAFAGNRLNVDSGTLHAGPTIVGMSGSVTGLYLNGAPQIPQYDMIASVRGLDLQQAASLASPHLAPAIAGSADADLHVVGAGQNPAISGSLSIPVGSVNGQGFRDFTSRVSGGLGGVALNAGSVALGTTALAFSGLVSPAAAQVAVHAPHADLADFNDFFDRGDTFSGSGHFDVALAAGGGRLQTNGNGTFSNARFRQFDFGNARARWSTVGNALRTDLAFASPSANVHVAGSAALPQVASLGDLGSVAQGTQINLTARARNVALITWLPLLGVTAPVVTGNLNADATVRGVYPSLAISASSDVRNGSVGHVPINSLHVAGRVLGDRGRIDAATLDIPYLRASAAGSFGLRPSDAFDVSARAASPDIGALAKVATGKQYDVAGTLDTNLHLSGTRADPMLSDSLTLASLRYAGFTAPRLSAQVVANKRNVAIRNGEVDLQRGRLLVAGALPFDLTSLSVGPGRGPVSLGLTTDDVELSNVAPLMPTGTKLGGRIDGRVTAGGTVAAPHLDGGLTLVGGSYNGPLDKDSLNNMSGQLALAGSAVSLRGLHADVGGGTLDIQGNAFVPNLYAARNVAFNFVVVAHHAQINSPQYYNGQLDAALTAKHTSGARTLVSGDVTASNARVPVSALYNPSSPAGPAPTLPNVGLDLGVNVGRNVRVQNGNIDVGATGMARLRGTLTSPTLDGGFTATGGTLNFYRNFRIARARVTFAPDSGLTPYVEAVAATRINDPTTDITIHATGPATGMQVAFASDPHYDREQILGLLVGAQQFGAVRGVQSSGGGNFSASSALRGVAFSQANQVFTRNLLEPLSSSLGGALGLSNLEIYSDTGTGIGTSAVKKFGKNLTGTTSVSFGTPRRSSFKLRYGRSDTGDLSLLIFQQTQATLLSSPASQPSTTVGNSVFGLTPPDLQFGLFGASYGFRLVYEKRYW